MLRDYDRKGEQLQSVNSTLLEKAANSYVMARYGSSLSGIYWTLIMIMALTLLRSLEGSGRLAGVKFA
jgi:hypothetical protein